MKKNVLVVVDYQIDFANPKGALYVPNAEKLADKIQTEIYNPKYDIVIYTMDSHILADYKNSKEAELFPAHCIFGTEGWDFFRIKTRNPEINTLMRNSDRPKDIVVDDEYVFVKDKFSIWEGNSNYADFMDSFDRDIELTIVGVATNYCVAQNAMGYGKMGFKNVSIIENAVEGIPDETFEPIISEMKVSQINFIGGE